MALRLRLVRQTVERPMSKFSLAEAEQRCDTAVDNCDDHAPPARLERREGIASAASSVASLTRCVARFPLGTCVHPVGTCGGRPAAGRMPEEPRHRFHRREIEQCDSNQHRIYACVAHPFCPFVRTRAFQKLLSSFSSLLSGCCFFAQKLLLALAEFAVRRSVFGLVGCLELLFVLEPLSNFVLAHRSLDALPALFGGTCSA